MSVLLTSMESFTNSQGYAHLSLDTTFEYLSFFALKASFVLWEIRSLSISPAIEKAIAMILLWIL